MGGLLTFASTGAFCCAGHAQTSTAGGLGCHVPGEDAPAYFRRTTETRAFARGDEHMEPRSGRPELDRAMARALSTISRTFNVLPGFAFFRDGGDHNALATPEQRLDRTDGTVLFGLGMLDELLGRPEHPDAAIISVCAHEFGHIVSYRTGLYRKLAPDRTKTFRSEQFADFMAGYFSGTRKLSVPSYPAIVFASTLRSLGGDTRGTHGTFDERGAAVAEGFKSAVTAKADLSTAIDTAVNYAMSRA